MKIILGIEFGNAYLKIAVGRSQGINIRLHDCIVFPIESNQEPEISNIITAQLQKAKYKSRSVVVSIPRNFVTVRNLHLPSSNEAEIKKMIGFHITRIVPHRIDEVVYSHCLSGKDAMGYQRVTLAIAHNEIIRRQMQVLDRAGFLVDGITLSSHCVWQRIIKEYTAGIKQKELYLILEIDALFADFIVFDRDDFLFTRSIAVKAKELNTEMGLKKFLGEVKQSLLIFQNEEINKKPDKIFFGGAVEGPLAKIIEKELEIPTQYVPPVFSSQGKRAKKKKAAQRQEDDQNVSMSAVAGLIRLAENERRLSFILPEIEIRKSLREKIMGLVVLGSLIIYFLGIVCFIFLSKIYNQENYIERLQEDHTRIEKDIGDLAQQVEKIAFTKKYLSARKSYLYAIFQLQKVMPPEMALNTIRIDSGSKVTLRGQVFQLAHVFDFVGSLEQVQYFKDVETKTTRKGKWRNQDVTDFELTLQIEMKLK